MHIMIILCLLFSAAHTVPAAEEEELITPNTYNGTPITADTLSKLSDHFDGSALLYDPTVCTHHNMNIPITDNNTGDISHWIKISGRSNRIFTGMHTHGAEGRVWTDQHYLNEQLAYLKQYPVATYQTASRAAYYLVAKEAINRKFLIYVGVPPTSLYSTNGSSIDDNHTIIRDEHIVGEKLEKKLQEGYEVPSYRLRELFTLTESIGLWNLKNNIIVDVLDHLVCIDLEQPNNSRAQDFFYKDPVRYHGNVACGIKELFTIFNGHPESLRTLIEMIELSDILSHEQFTPQYQKEILDFASKQDK